VRSAVARRTMARAVPLIPWTMFALACNSVNVVEAT
jgi:hypothetical protein